MYFRFWANAEPYIYRTSLTSPPSSQSSRPRSPRGRTLRLWSSPSPTPSDRSFNKRQCGEEFQNTGRVDADICKNPQDGGGALDRGVRARGVEVEVVYHTNSSVLRVFFKVSPLAYTDIYMVVMWWHLMSSSIHSMSGDILAQAPIVIQKLLHLSGRSMLRCCLGPAHFISSSSLFRPYYTHSKTDILIINCSHVRK